MTNVGRESATFAIMGIAVHHYRRQCLAIGNGEPIMNQSAVKLVVLHESINDRQ